MGLLAEDILHAEVPLRRVLEVCINNRSFSLIKVHGILMLFKPLGLNRLTELLVKENVLNAGLEP